jgi:hypothetical protein
MKLAITLVAMGWVLAAAAPIAGAAGSRPETAVSGAALAQAGRRSTLKAIDYGRDYCDGGTTVAAWLEALVGKEARAIRWTGGKCQIVSDQGPLDVASWRWCAQATVSLVHPRNRSDTPMIEIFFEKPVRGHPGAAYAFRGVMMTRDDGDDISRFRKDFEAEWRDRFPVTPDAAGCED